MLDIYGNYGESWDYRVTEDAEARRRLLGELIAERKRLGLSQQQVAVRLKVSGSVIVSLEREVTDPRLSLLQGYARAVGLHLITLLT